MAQTVTEYTGRDTPANGPVIPVHPPVPMFETILSCGCGEHAIGRDDVSLGEVVDWLSTPATRGTPSGCICEVSEPGRPYRLTLLA